MCSPGTEITHGHCYAQLSLHGFLEAGGGLNSGPVLTTPHIFFLLALQTLRPLFLQETALFTTCIHVCICLYTHVCEYEFPHICLSIHLNF